MRLDPTTDLAGRLPPTPTGVLSSTALRSAGFTDYDIRLAARLGLVQPVRRGWYRTANANREVLRAIAAGGALSGVHALVPFGAWIAPKPPRLQIVQHRRDRRYRDAPDNLVGHDGRGITRLETPFGLAPWRIALHHTIRAASLEDAVAAVDGLLFAGQRPAMHPEHIDPELLLSHLGTTTAGRWVRAWSNRRSESIIETYPRVRFLKRGWSVEVQRPLSSDERLDLVVNGIVGLELDGRRHAEPGQYVRDHAKAARAALEGLIPLRFSFSQVIYEWDLVEAAVEQMVEIGRAARMRAADR